MKNNKRNIIILFILSIIIFYFILKDDFNNIITNLLNMKFYYILLILIIILISDLFKALAFNKAAEANNIECSYKKSFKLILISHFFDGITPFASGGQAYQILKLKKDNINYSKGIGLVFYNYSMFQISFVIITTLSIILNNLYKYIKLDSVVTSILSIAYILNLIIVFILLALLLNKNKKENIIDKILEFLKKIKILSAERHISLKNKILAVKSAIFNIKKNKKDIFLLLLYNMLYIIFFYSVHYFIFVSLGINNINILSTFIVYVYVILVSLYTPMPGAVIGFEVAYLSLFGIVLSGSILKTSLIIWRFLGYYLLMIIGFIVLLFDKKDVSASNKIKK